MNSKDAILDYYNKAVRYEELNRYNDALIDYKKVLELDNEYIPAIINMSRIYGKLMWYIESIEYCDMALGKDPSNVVALNNKAVILQDFGNYNKALEYFNKALEIEPTYHLSLYNKGRYYAQLGQDEEAIKCYDKALELESRNIDIFISKGLSWENLKRDDEAIDCYDKALELNSNSYVAWTNKGNSLSNLNRIDEAIDCYDKALEINSVYIDALINKGFTLEKLHKYKEAIKCYDKALELNSNSYVAWTNKGNCLSSLGKDTEAIDYHHKSLEILPNFYISWLNKGNSLSNLNRYDEAIDCYDKALELEPSCDTATVRKSKVLESDDYVLNNDTSYIINRSQKNNWKINQRITIFDSFTFEKLYDLEVEASMGEVFLVYQIDTNRLSIVKTVLISSSYSNEENLSNEEALFNEAKILLTLDPHPNIVECSLVEELNGRIYIFMEYIDGGNLEKLICENSKIEIDLFLNITKQIVNGMIHAHKNGLIHSDLKPSNILFSLTNNKLVIKISDFGLSKMIDITNTNIDYSGLTNSSNNVTILTEDKQDFTKAYSAPEQEDLLNDITIGATSDIFSFGIIMIELLTSTLGFKNEIDYYKYFSNLDNKVEEFIRNKNSDVPEKLVEIIKKCLNIDPKRRYLSFEDVLKDLNSVIKEDNNKDYQNNENKLWIEDNSKWILYYATRGYSLKRLKYGEDAKKQLEKAIQIKPKLFSDYINLGLAYFDLGRFEDAIYCYDKILNLRPENKYLALRVYINKGNTLYESGRFEDAIYCYDKILEIDPNNLIALNKKRDALFHLKTSS